MKPTPSDLAGQTAGSAASSMADMPGMAPTPSRTAEGATSDAGMDMRGGPTPGMDMGAPVPFSAPPPPPTDHAADRYFDPVAMAAAREQLREDHGGMSFHQVLDNLAEYQGRSSGGGGYRWDGEAWIGGDIDRLVLKTEGEGAGAGVDSAEGQALYSRAIGPYFNAQGGVRQDVAPYGRTYATIGVEGLAPYWIDFDSALFLSTKGEVLARVEGLYDLRLSQRLILQPRVELNFAAQSTNDTRTGSGLSNAEFGLRLRYEVRREFAPYLGVSYDRKLGRTADFARLSGQDPIAASVVVGVRAWF